MKIFERMFRGKPKPKPQQPPQGCEICRRFLEMIELANKSGAEKRFDYLDKELARHVEIHHRINPYVSPED